MCLLWSGREGDPAHDASQQRRGGRPDPRGRGHQPHAGGRLVHRRAQVSAGFLFLVVVNEKLTAPKPGDPRQSRGQPADPKLRTFKAEQTPPKWYKVIEAK